MKFFSDKVKRRLVTLCGGNRHARITKRSNVKAPALESFLRAAPPTNVPQELERSSSGPPQKNQTTQQAAEAQIAVTFYAIAETCPEESETSPTQTNTTHAETPASASDTPTADEPSIEGQPEQPTDPEYVATPDGAEDGHALPPSEDCIFEGEDESDYTSGPAKMVVAYDESQACPAIMLNFELSTKLQLALSGQRELQRTEFLICQDRESLEMEEQRIYGRLVCARQDLEYFSAGKDHTEPQTAARIREFKIKINDLKREHTNVREELQTLGEILQDAYAKQRMLQAEANAILDDVFVNCNLLVAQEIQVGTDSEVPPAQITTQQPDGSLLSSLPSPRSGPPTGYGYGAENLGLQVGIDDKDGDSPQARARRSLMQKKIEFVNAVEEFDRHHDHHGNDPNARQRAAMAGVKITTQTDLDLFNLKRGQELTRKLIEAEEAVRAANAEAKVAGVVDDQTSETGKHQGEDEESFETEFVAPTDMSSVQQWLENVENGADPDLPPDDDADDWNFEPDDRPWESVSVMAQGSEREKIDQWCAMTQKTGS